MFRLAILTSTFISLSLFAKGPDNLVVKTLKESGFEDLNLKFYTSFEKLDGAKNSYEIMSNKLSLNTKVAITDDIHLNADLGFKFENGQARSTYDKKRYSPTSSLNTKYFYFNINVLDLFEVDLGALNNTTKEATSEFVNYGPTSLGLRESVTYNSDYIDLIAVANQTKPNNDELSQRLDRDETGKPEFFSEFVTVKLKYDNHFVAVKAGQFAYKNLSNNTAYTDQYYGNSVLGGKEETSEYKYTFKGKNLDATASVVIYNDIRLEVNKTQSKNYDATTGHDTAKKQSASIIFGDKSTTSVTYTDFSVDSDAFVAYYNKSDYKNNTEGTIFSIEIKNENGFQLGFKKVDRNIIESSIYLSNEKLYMLTLGKDYDIF